MRPSVLVVEDYVDLASAIVAALVRRDYRCDNVTTSEAAVDLLRDHRYDTILLAPRLPISDDPVMHFLASAQPGELAKVVLMTNDDGDEPAPGARVLSIPFNDEELLAEVGR
jgi:DNA-binding response OmpR family regulator